MKPLSDQLDLPPLAAFFLRWGRRVAIGVAGLVAALLVVELAAAHFLPKRSTRFLRDGTSNGQPAWIDNSFFSYRFSTARAALPPPPIVVPKTPAPDTLRVCLLGGSATMGFPDPSFGIGRQLELMLRLRYPDHPVEVVHMAIEGGNTHVLREVARDLKRLQPQAVIVMTGNDEVAGPYGPASSLGRFHRSSRIARLMVLFSRTYLSQLWTAALARASPARADLQAWSSQEPITLQSRMSPDDPRLRGTYRSFRKNLTAILRQAAEASPVVVACTVPVNLRDCAPFSTRYQDDETVAQEVREKMRAAIAAEAATNRIEASRLYADIIRRDPTHAEALFRAARLALAANRTAEAAELFSRARDADALRLRADSRLNALVRECAAETSASLLDAEALFAIRSSQGIPGRELFLDHVHYTFEATHLLASSMLDRMEFLRAFDPEPTGSVPGAEALANELLYDPWDRSAQLDALIGRQLRPPFRRQFDNVETLARLREEKRTLDARVAAIPQDNARAIFARRQAIRPHDIWLAVRTAHYLLDADAPVLAEAAAATALDRWPHRFEIRALVALIRSVQGQKSEEGITFLRGQDEDAGYYDISQSIAVGTELLKMQRAAEARPWLEYALRRDPWNSEAAIELANAFHQMNGGNAAVGILQSAIERNPDNPLLWENIASHYCLLGHWKIATKCFRKSEEIAPYRYERLLIWAQAMVRLRQYDRAHKPIQNYLAAMPGDPEGLAILEVIQSHLSSDPDISEESSKEEDSSRKFPWE